MEKQRQELVIAEFKTEFYQIQDRYKSGLSVITGIFDKAKYHIQAQTFTEIELYSENKRPGSIKESKRSYKCGRLALVLEKKYKDILWTGFKKITQKAFLN